MEILSSWFVINTLLMLVYGSQHSLFTSRLAVQIFNRYLPAKLWNIMYSLLSIALIVVAVMFWQRSSIQIYRLEGIWYFVAIGGMALSVFMFFYCFKYTTSFWQWIGLEQVWTMITGKEDKPYYRVRKYGLKRYMRFPHHFFLVTLFWSQPAMTLDTLWFAIFATVYTYIGTVHQDSRGRRLLGDEWVEYSKQTNLLFPNPLHVLKDLVGARRSARTFNG